MRNNILGIALLLVVSPGLRAQVSSADYTQPHQRQALEILGTSIGFRTAATHGHVPALANFLADQFRAGGFSEEDVHVIPFTVPGGEETASLIVRYRGDGSSGKKPILLLAHMDVVDALPKDWERDPFTLIEEEGYFFGRGVFDDKFGVTTLTTNFLRLKAEGFVPTRDLIVAFTGDEETGMLTARALVTTHRPLTDAEFALNADGGGGVLGEDGEALRYLVQTSEKTYATFELTLTNPGGHSSTPRTDNAIYELASVLKSLEAHRFPVRVNETTRRYFRAASAITPGRWAGPWRVWPKIRTTPPRRRCSGTSPNRWGSPVPPVSPPCFARDMRRTRFRNRPPRRSTAESSPVSTSATFARHCCG